VPSRTQRTTNLFTDLDDFRRRVAQIPRHKIESWLWKHTNARQPLKALMHEVDTRLALMDLASASKIEVLEAYVSGICRHVAMDWIRERMRIQKNSSEKDVNTIPHPTANPEKAAASAQELEQLERAITGLPENQHQVYWLRKIYGYSDKEIAERMKTNVREVQNTLRNAVRRIDAAMRKVRGGDDVGPEDCHLGFEEDV
jgi:RNA polymerase sigma factor (sigma-70 family)